MYQEWKSELLERLDARHCAPLMTPRRLAALLDVHRQRIYEMIHAGDLEAVRLGTRRLRVTRASAEAWVRRWLGDVPTAEAQRERRLPGGVVRRPAD